MGENILECQEMVECSIGMKQSVKVRMVGVAGGVVTDLYSCMF